VVGLLDAGKGGKEKSKTDFLRRFDETMNANTLRDQLLPDSLPTSTMQAGTTTQPLPLPDPSTASPRRQLLVRALCRAHIRFGYTVAIYLKAIHENPDLPLAYALMYFLRGALPWQGLKAATKKQKYDRIVEKKMTTRTDLICRGYILFLHIIFYLHSFVFRSHVCYHVLCSIVIYVHSP